jgi:hypothetical protein
VETAKDASSAVGEGINGPLGKFLGLHAGNSLGLLSAALDHNPGPQPDLANTTSLEQKGAVGGEYTGEGIDKGLGTGPVAAYTLECGGATLGLVADLLQKILHHRNGVPLPDPTKLGSLGATNLTKAGGL